MSKTITMLPTAYQTSYQHGILKLYYQGYSLQVINVTITIKMLPDGCQTIYQTGILKALLPRLQPTSCRCDKKTSVMLNQSHIKQVIMQGKTRHYYQDFSIKSYRCEQN